mgnify:FL=1
MKQVLPHADKVLILEILRKRTSVLSAVRSRKKDRNIIDEIERIQAIREKLLNSDVELIF